MNNKSKHDNIIDAERQLVANIQQFKEIDIEQILDETTDKERQKDHGKYNTNEIGTLDINFAQSLEKGYPAFTTLKRFMNHNYKDRSKRNNQHEIHHPQSDTNVYKEPYNTELTEEQELEEKFRVCCIRIAFLLKKGQKKEAIKFIDLALKYKPNNISIMYTKALAFIELMEYGDAIKLFGDVLMQDKKHVGALKYLGHCALLAKEWRDAFFYYKRALDQNSRDPSIMQGLGRTYVGMIDLTKAAIFFSKSIELEPNITRLFDLGSVLMLMRKIDQACNCFERCIELDGQFLPAYLNMANCLRASNPKRSLDVLNEAQRIKDEEDPHIEFNRSLTYLHLNDTQQALVSIKKTEDLEKKLLAKAESSKEDDESKQKQQQEPINAYLEQYVSSHHHKSHLIGYVRGLIFFMKKDFHQAIEHLEVSLKIKQDYPPSMILLSKCLNAVEDYTGALSICDASLKTTTQDCALHVLRANILSNMKEYDEALASLDNAHTLNPLANFIFLQKADINHRKSDYDRALECYDACLQLTPDYFPQRLVIQQLRNMAAMKATSKRAFSPKDRSAIMNNVPEFVRTFTQEKFWDDMERAKSTIKDVLTKHTKDSKSANKWFGDMKKVPSEKDFNREMDTVTPDGYDPVEGFEPMQIERSFERYRSHLKEAEQKDVLDQHQSKQGDYGEQDYEQMKEQMRRLHQLRKHNIAHSDP